MKRPEGRWEGGFRETMSQRAWGDGTRRTPRAHLAWRVGLARFPPAGLGEADDQGALAAGQDAVVQGCDGMCRLRHRAHLDQRGHGQAGSVCLQDAAGDDAATGEEARNVLDAPVAREALDVYVVVLGGRGQVRHPTLRAAMAKLDDEGPAVQGGSGCAGTGGVGLRCAQGWAHACPDEREIPSPGQALLGHARLRDRCKLHEAVAAGPLRPTAPRDEA